MNEYETPAEPIGGVEETPEPAFNWLKLAQEAFESSTSYVDNNYRKKWDDSLRAHNNEHPSDSKYSSPRYEKRSKVYRPKTRSVTRKNEAALSAALFSNMDAVSIEPMNQGIPEQVISAPIMKEIIQYRLTHSIPWLPVAVGGLQDAQKQGAAIAHIYWKYEKRADGYVISDKPCIDLKPIENIRLDPAADWMDPINSSPYLIDLIPMYVVDVKRKMTEPDPKGQPWRQYPDEKIQKAMASYDQTRMERNRNEEDPYTISKPVKDYEVVFIQRHIHRREGRDWHFYTLGTECLLTDPEPLENVVFHGRRPYVMGYAILETHKVYKPSVHDLVGGLATESNEVANQRLDNVKFVLNKRWIVKRGKNVDINSLIRNVPGGVTQCDDPVNDIKESNWPDVTASAYAEQERIDNDFNELIGNFNASAIPNKAASETARGMALLQAPSGMLTDYTLLTFVETFIEPLLRQLVLLEQFYETDQTILAIAADKAKLFQKFGQNQVTDEMLAQQLTVKVNVGMGATDPVQKLNKFLHGITAYANVAKMGTPGVDLSEIAKEIFALTGYQDGKRFFGSDDPQVAMLTQQLQQAQQMMQAMQQELQSKQASEMARLQATRETNQTQLVKQDMVGQQKLQQMFVQGEQDIEAQEAQAHHDTRKEIVRANARPN